MRTTVANRRPCAKLGQGQFDGSPERRGKTHVFAGKAIKKPPTPFGIGASFCLWANEAFAYSHSTSLEPRIVREASCFLQSGTAMCCPVRSGDKLGTKTETQTKPTALSFKICPRNRLTPFQLCKNLAANAHARDVTANSRRARAERFVLEGMNRTDWAMARELLIRHGRRGLCHRIYGKHFAGLLPFLSLH